MNRPVRSVVAAAVVAVVLPIVAGAAQQSTPEAGQAARHSGEAALRERATRELRARVSEPDRLKHADAVEAIMEAFAAAAGGDRAEWGLAGLLHDIDLADTRTDPSRHGIVGARLLATLGFSDAVVRAVEAHDDAAGVRRTTPIAHALYCADNAYWAIWSSGLRFPSAEASSATPASVVEGLERRGAMSRISARFTEECSVIGLTRDDTFRLSLQAMRVGTRSR